VSALLSQQNANLAKGQLADGNTRWTFWRTINCSRPPITGRSSSRIATARPSGSRTSQRAGWRGKYPHRRFLNGKPSIPIIILRQPGANIIETVDRIKAGLPSLKASIPAGIRMDVVLDRTTTIRASVREIERTLLISIGLVILVVFIFLRSPRGTLIPRRRARFLDRDVGVMYLFGYSVDIFR